MLDRRAARRQRPLGPSGAAATNRHKRQSVQAAEQPTLRGRLLDDESALTLRVITDPRGPIQSGIVAFNEVLLRRDMAEFGLVPVIEPSALAYALARLGESLFYVELLAARQPDMAAANRLQQALIEGILP